MVEENSWDTFEIRLPPKEKGKGEGLGWGWAVEEAQEGEIQDYEIIPEVNSVEEFDTILEGLIVASAQSISIEEIKQSLDSHLQHLDDESRGDPVESD